MAGSGPFSFGPPYKVTHARRYEKEPRLSSGGAGGAERCHEAGNTENKGTFECTAHTASS